MALLQVPPGDRDCSVGLFDGGGYRCLTVTQPGEVISTFTDWVTG